MKKLKESWMFRAIFFLFLLCGHVGAEEFEWTYLDLVDSSIKFDPVMFRNWVCRGDLSYAIFAEDENVPTALPGYESGRCVAEVQLAEALGRIQTRLRPLGLGIKVYDCYRPQRTVDYFIKWTLMSDTPLVKKYHYPRTEKRNFHDLDYLSRLSSHTKGTAVDVTLVPLELSPEWVVMPEDFLGIWDPESLDMGVGYLCFDPRSSFSYQQLTDIQRNNRDLLRRVMFDEGFVPLEAEFWHFYYLPERNQNLFYDFPITEEGVQS